MKTYDEVFSELKNKKEGALVAFIVIGDPDYETSLEISKKIVDSGADMLELGIPFSDPIADGPTIQKSSERGLKSKTTLASVFNLVRSVRLQIQTPIVFLIYYNLVFHYGLERFINAAVYSGVDGVVIPDLPPEESKDLCKIARKNKFATITIIPKENKIINQINQNKHKNKQNNNKLFYNKIII